MPLAMYLAYFLQRELSTQIQALLPKYDVTIHPRAIDDGLR